MRLTALNFISNTWTWVLAAVGGLTILITFWEKIGGFICRSLRGVRKRINKPAMEALDGLKKELGDKLDLILVNQDNTNIKIKEISEAQLLMTISHEAMMDVSNMMYWISNKEGYTVKVSNSAVNYLGRSERELQEGGWVSYIPKEYHDALYKEWEQAITHQRDFTFQYPFKRGKGYNDTVQINAHAHKAGECWFGVLTPIN